MHETFARQAFVIHRCFVQFFIVNHPFDVLFIVHHIAYNKKKHETEVLLWDTIQIWRLNF